LLFSFAEGAPIADISISHLFVADVGSKIALKGERVHEQLCGKGIKEQGLSTFSIQDCENDFPELFHACLALKGNPKEKKDLQGENLAQGLRALVLIANMPCPFGGAEDDDDGAETAIEQFGDLQSVAHAIRDNKERTSALGLHLAMAALAAFKSVEEDVEEEDGEEKAWN